MSEIMLKISHISKQYKLGQIGGTTLREELQRWNAKRRKQEDPTRKIGARDYSTGESFMALDDVSFEAMKGERIGIIGHNGAGKSTLLKLISRITAPTSGDIWMNGRVASMLEVGTGFHGELTGRENIYMNGAILGMKKKEIDEKIENIIEFSECRQFIDTPVKRYSSGMYVKLAFSVVAHLDSEIMIMDEVLAVGDMAFQKKCLEKMKDVSRQEERTILYVSHNMNTIRQLCDRCIVLNHGRITFDGDVEEAISLYLQNDTSDSISNIDLEGRERPENSTNQALIRRIEFLDNKGGVYSRGTPLRFKLSWSALNQLHDVRYRMIVRYIDDTPVGLVQSPILGDFEKNSVQATLFMFNTDFLADGRFFFSIALYENDDVGNSIILDHVTRAFTVDIVSSVDDENKLVWQHRWWGSVIFPSLIVEESYVIQEGKDDEQY